MQIIESISAFHRLANLPAPLHPLVSVYRVTDTRLEDDAVWKQFSINFYAISLKKGMQGKIKYGQHYLSDMLRTSIGQSAQQHIQDKMIEKAKGFLTISNLSVAEIAYYLGFKYPQSFNKLFKKKTNLSPLEFRQSFNL